MVIKKGFDTEKYVEIQSREILNRVRKFNKLYLEFGGKLSYDFHAMRVLPGYESNAKIQILQKIKDNSEIVFCISAKDIESGKIRADFNLSYSSMVLKSINDLRAFGLDVSTVVINRFSGEEKALKFQKYLENVGIKTYLQKEIEGYPADIDKIVSDKGYGQNPYVETKKSIVIVTGAGPGSGKMSFCLSQVYLDHMNGITSGFAKFETFPIWNLPLTHPVNIAYEAATVDLNDKNMVDPFYLNKCNQTAINYNRDIENFPILKKILDKIGNVIYDSPTEMGVNMAKHGIISDEVVCEAAKQEIIRRYFRHKKENVLGICDKVVVDRVEVLMQGLGLKEVYRRVVLPARNAAVEAETRKDKGNKGFYCGSAIEIDGEIITGKNSKLFHSESACVLNALKYLTKIPQNMQLLPENIIQSIRSMKKNLKEGANPSLEVNEVLVALAFSSTTNPAATECLNKLSLLKGVEMHTTYLPSRGDEEGLRDLGINVTTDAELGPKIYVGD